MQISMFDGTKPFKLDKPVRLIECFAGYGSQHFSLEYLGVNFESWRICEWAVKSIQAYKDAHFPNDNTDYSKDLTKEQLIDYLANKGISANYNEPMSGEQIKRLSEDKLRTIYNNIMATHNLVNICQVHAKDLNIVDTDKYDYVLTYSFPCGLAGTKVITKNGYKNIEDISTDDYVQTHNNRYCKVVKTMSRISNHYYVLKGLGVPELYLTEEHPLYVFRDGKFQWVKVKDLKLTDMFSFNINQNEKDVNLSEEYLWLLGRYVADGWVNKRLYNSVEFAISYSKEKEFLKNIPSEFVPKFKKFKKKCWEYRIADKTFQDFCEEFGNGALNKCIPSWIIDLPKNKLQAFFNGYISGDGHIRERSGAKQIMFSTVSETLFLGMQQIAAKLYGSLFTCSIRKDKRKPTFNDTYNCQINTTPHHRDQFVNKDKICTKIRKIERFDESVPVYNFEVEDDNSYTCQNVIVHNCQDLSLAGKQKGMEKGSGTRSGMLWEVERILDECDNLPQVLLMENVPEVIGTNNIKHFAKWLEKLESLGYKCYWKVLNGKDYGVPQNRERCFMVSILGDYYYNFPETQKLETKLKDILLDKVDEKFYLSDDKISSIAKWKAQQDPLKDIDKEKIVCPTLTARGAGEEHSGMILINEPLYMGTFQYAKSDNFMQGRERFVPDKDVSDTIQTQQKEGIVLAEENLKRKLCNELIKSGKVKEGDVIRHSYSNSRMKKFYPSNQENHDCSPTLDTRCDCLGVVQAFSETEKKLFTEDGNIKRYINSDIVDKFEEGQMATTTYPNGYGHGPRTHNESIALNTIDKPVVKKNLRIRKLVPQECFRLMGVKDEDFYRIAKNQSDASLWHLAGDSIIVDVLMAIFREML